LRWTLILEWLTGNYRLYMIWSGYIKTPRAERPQRKWIRCTLWPLF
jgi:hypothetical protein